MANHTLSIEVRTSVSAGLMPAGTPLFRTELSTPLDPGLLVPRLLAVLSSVVEANPQLTPPELEWPARAAAGAVEARDDTARVG